MKVAAKESIFCGADTVSTGKESCKNLNVTCCLDTSEAHGAAKASL